MRLDNAVRSFRSWAEGNSGLDELDFKEEIESILSECIANELYEIGNYAVDKGDADLMNYIDSRLDEIRSDK